MKDAGVYTAAAYAGALAERLPRHAALDSPGIWSRTHLATSPRLTTIRSGKPAKHIGQALDELMEVGRQAWVEATKHRDLCRTLPF